jgi:group I intron endonuclease
MADAILAQRGIYAIRNKTNNKCYIGSSVNIAKRWLEHIWALNSCRHHSQKLQRAWNKYPAEAFEYVILELVDPSVELFVREQVWMDSSEAASLGYNIFPAAGSSAGSKRSTEARARMSTSAIKRGVAPETMRRLHDVARNPSPATRLKMSASRTGKKSSPEAIAKFSATMTGRLGRPLSDATKAKLSAINMGKKASDETRAKISAAVTGRKVSKETLEKMRLAQGKKSPEWRQKLSVSLTGKVRSTESRAKMSASKSGTKWSEEGRAKRAAARAARLAAKAPPPSP